MQLYTLGMQYHQVVKGLELLDLGDLQTNDIKVVKASFPVRTILQEWFLKKGFWCYSIYQSGRNLPLA